MNTSLNFRRSLVALVVICSLLVASKDASAQKFAATCPNYVRTLQNDGFSTIAYDEFTNYLGSDCYYSWPYNYIYQSLPFDFIYDSTTYTAGSPVYIHQNGALSFSYTGNYDYGNSISNGQQASFPNYMNAWGFVYYPYSCGSNEYSEVTGFVGSRVWTLEFDNVGTYYSGYTVSIQIKLYETTNAIEFIYSGNSQYVGYGYTGGIGINGATNNDINAYQSQSNQFQYSSAIYTPSGNILFSPPQITNIQLSVKPKLLSYGSHLAGTTSAPLCITVQNVGTFGVLNVNSATITGAQDFAIVSSPESNSYDVGSSPGQYCITFSPTQSGLRTATLNIATNGKDSGVQSVALTGIGLVAEYTIDSLIRFKKTRTPLGDSLTQYLHITSTGGVPLFISAFTFGGGDPGQYFISHFPVNPLPPGQSDSIGITYVPTLEGRHTATLTLTSNSYFHPSVVIQLLGIGILPHIVVTPSLLLFDSTREGDTVCKNITIFNPGSDTLKLSSNFLTSNDGDFHYTGLSGSDTAIAPEQSKTVGVCFIPIQQGERQARLFLKTNIIKTFETPRRDTAGIVTVNISGTGVPFGLFAFTVSGSPFTDSALVGVQVCRQDTLKNNGDADILVNGFAISGTNGSDFSSSGLPSFPFLLKARSFKTFTICGTPDKQGLLTGTGTVSGTTSGSNVSLGLPLGIFGFVPCIAAKPASLFINPQVTLPNNGSDSVLCDTITNCGDIAAVYTATISGTSKADYSVTPAQSAVVPAKGGKTIFCVTYKPSVVGVSPASLNVAAADGSTSVKIPLSGADGCAVLTATTPEVPNTGVGAKGTFTVTINNTGTFPLILGNGSIAPADGHFKFIGAVPDTIPPGGSSTVTLEFDPSEVGTVSAALSFPTSGPCLSDTLNVTLNGQGIVNSVNETASEGFSLDQSYPNPTQGNTWFTYTTPRETEISLKLVDMTGKLVRTLITGRVSEGPHTVNFDASNLPSGTYIYMLESGSTRLVRQLILTK